eukprot:472010_1
MDQIPSIIGFKSESYGSMFTMPYNLFFFMFLFLVVIQYIPNKANNIKKTTNAMGIIFVLLSIYSSNINQRCYVCDECYMIVLITRMVYVYNVFLILLQII